jgi:hypothetical protein
MDQAPAAASRCGDATDRLAHSTGMRKGVPTREMRECPHAVEQLCCDAAIARAGDMSQRQLPEAIYRK